MYDIKFFEAAKVLRDRIVAGEFGPERATWLAEQLEGLRSPHPTLFNCETTNYCNMTCQMCPRTTLMDRKNIWIDDALFEKVVSQLRPHDPADFEHFWSFIKDSYRIEEWEPTENFFYFWVVSRCLILHGYGEPLLDKKIVDRVTSCTRRSIPTYFSCVPANITVERCRNVMKAGVSFLKFSMDGLDDEFQKKIRGQRNDFEASYRTILDILEMKKAEGYDTKVVITMIALSEDEAAREMHRRFLDLWRPHDVFAYVKSQDNRWYFEDDKELVNRSHYEQQYCEYPWTSLTVMADGSVVPCTQDYNCEMSFGNAAEQSLEEIWNSEGYRRFRQMHVSGDFPKGHKCTERCDNKKLFRYLRPKP